MNRELFTGLKSNQDPAHPTDRAIVDALQQGKITVEDITTKRFAVSAAMEQYFDSESLMGSLAYREFMGLNPNPFYPENDSETENEVQKRLDEIVKALQINRA